MEVQLLVTKNDFNLSNLENQFRDLCIAYQVDFVEDHPEIVSALNIRHSPNIIVDGELVFPIDLLDFPDIGQVALSA